MMVLGLPVYRRHHGPGKRHNPVLKGVARNQVKIATTQARNKVRIIFIKVLI
jgi:hypothetical protein